LSEMASRLLETEGTGMNIIDNLMLSGSNAAQTGKAAESGLVEQGRRAGAQKAGPAVSGDQVRLSGLSGKITDAMSTDAANRAARVAELTSAVRGGTYQINTKAISRAMISDSLATTGAGK
jgi:flagellar biosynthesis anti-sigma factor FlgM